MICRPLADRKKERALASAPYITLKPPRGCMQRQDDMSKIIEQLIQRTNRVARTTETDGRGQRGSPAVDPQPSTPSAARTPGYDGVGRHDEKASSSSDFGGDPRNAYRELRRYLMDIGIDTRIFTVGSVPLPQGWSRGDQPTNTIDIRSLDNSFFFDMRKTIESGVCWHDDTDKPEQVSALVIMFRVFFDNGMDGTRFWVQAVLNHHHDGILRLNELYGRTIIPQLKQLQWTQPTRGQEGRRVSYFEKLYTNVDSFKQEFNRMYRRYRQAGMHGNNMVQLSA